MEQHIAELEAQIEALQQSKVWCFRTLHFAVLHFLATLATACHRQQTACHARITDRPDIKIRIIHRKATGLPTCNYLDTRPAKHVGRLDSVQKSRSCGPSSQTRLQGQQQSADGGARGAAPAADAAEREALTAELVRATAKISCVARASLHSVELARSASFCRSSAPRRPVVGQI